MCSARVATPSLDACDLLIQHDVHVPHALLGKILPRQVYGHLDLFLLGFGINLLLPLDLLLSYLEGIFLNHTKVFSGVRLVLLAEDFDL